MQILLYVLVGVVVGLTGWWIHRFNFYAGKESLYLKIVSKLDAITLRAQAIQKLSEHLDDERVLKYFEENLHRVENILHMVKGLPDGPNRWRTLVLMMKMVALGISLSSHNQ